MTVTHVPQRDRSAAVLNKARRQADLNRPREETVKDDIPDLLIIDVGITGVGIVLDAALRSLKAVLVESKGLASGTSCWSSKLAHGGLRYLANGNAGIARRSAIERGALLDVTTPYLVHNLPQVMPVMDKFTPLTRILPRLGSLAGDFLRIIAGTPATTLPLSRTVSPRRVSQLSPTVRKRDVRFGYVNYDDRLRDDARLVTAIARIAASYGTAILTQVHCENASGTSATLIDELTGEPFELPTHAIVSTTGVRAAELAANIKIRPSRGTHLILDTAKLGDPTGSLTVPVPGHTNRFYFILPAEHNRVYIGLADEDVPGLIPNVPKVPEDDTVSLLDVTNQALEIPLTRDDVIGVFADLHPLIDAGKTHTASLSREHALLEAPNSLIPITGGKLTERRLIAEQAVDKVAEKLDVSLTPCSTHTVLVLGSEPEALDRVHTAATAGCILTPLFSRYGAESFETIESCPLDRPLDPVAEGLDVTRAEFAWHMTHEGALSVDDIPDRRTRLGLVMADRGAALPATEGALGLA